MEHSVISLVRGRSDDALIQALSEGDQDALAELYDRHAAAAYRVAYGICLVAEEAEDVVQEVFIELMRRVPVIEDPNLFDAWIRRVAARSALSRLRTSRRRRQLRERHIGEPDGNEQRPHDLATIARLEVVRLLELLPAKLRAVVVLRELEQRTHVEVARALGISASASKVRLHRAMRILRKHVERNEL